jgi:hypothetical protein
LNPKIRVARGGDSLVAAARNCSGRVSKLIRKPAVFVFGIGNQPLIFAIHHPIQIFQRNLPGDVRQRVGD